MQDLTPTFRVQGISGAPRGPGPGITFWCRLGDQEERGVIYSTRPIFLFPDQGVVVKATTRDWCPHRWARASEHEVYQAAPEALRTFLWPTVAGGRTECGWLWSVQPLLRGQPADSLAGDDGTYHRMWDLAEGLGFRLWDDAPTQMMQEHETGRYWCIDYEGWECPALVGG